uniref:Uncharacterized protein n=1 Tax=Kalanchoe fedtschenkoi TaxID=63787 RepID=A0A7N0TUA2_KALFE
MSSSDQRHSSSQSSPAAAASNEVAAPQVIDEEGGGMNSGYASSEEIGFRTPTSRDHRIPRSRSCPPAPRKPRPVSLGHKRKLAFENAAREEVEAFFDRSKRRSFRNRDSSTAPRSSNDGCGS